MMQTAEVSRQRRRERAADPLTLCNLHQPSIVQSSHMREREREQSKNMGFDN